MSEQDPKERPFTRLTVEIIGYLKALGQAKCPICKAPIYELRNEISHREFSISGMCQECQDSEFGTD